MESVALETSFRLAIVLYHFDLDPVAAAGSAGEARDAHGFIGSARARRVRHEHAFSGNVLEDISVLRAEVDSPERDGDHLRARGVNKRWNDFVARVFPGTDKDAARKFRFSYGEYVVCVHFSRLRET